MHVTCSPPFRLVALLTASALVGSGCTSMHQVPVVAPGPSQTTSMVKPGDNVRVTMRDGRTAQFTVGQVEASAITARGGERYATDQIATVERRTFSATKTTVLIAGALGGVFLLAYGFAVASLGRFGV
jgi:hypothetical protein